MLDSRKTMGNGNCCSCRHQFLKCILNKTLRLCVECRGSLIKNKDRRILQNGTGDTNTLTLTTREPSATITDHGLIAILRLCNKLMGIGNPCCLLYLLVSCVLHAKCDIVSKCIVEKDCLLIYVSYKLTKVVYAEILHINTINQHLSLLSIIIARNEINEG